MGSHCLKVMRARLASASSKISWVTVAPLVDGSSTTSLPSFAIARAASIKGLLASSATTFPFDPKIDSTTKERARHAIDRRG